MGEIEVSFVVLLALIGLGLPMVGVQENFWGGLCIWGVVAGLGAHIVWRWQKVANLGTPARLISSAGVVLVVAVLLAGPLRKEYHRSHAIAPYPWVGVVSVGTSSNGEPAFVNLGIGVADDAPRGSPHLASLYNVHVVVEKVIAIFPDPIVPNPTLRLSWCSCIVMDFKSPELNLDGMFNEQQAVIPFKDRAMAFTFSASARDGEWLGELLLTRGKGGELNSESWIATATTDQPGAYSRMLIRSIFAHGVNTVSSVSGVKNVREELRRIESMRKARLLEQGVPVYAISRERAHQICGDASHTRIHESHVNMGRSTFRFSI